MSICFDKSLFRTKYFTIYNASLAISSLGDDMGQLCGIIMFLLLGYRVFANWWSDIKKLQVDLFCCAT